MRAINAALLWLTAVVAFYGVAMHYDNLALKYYPQVNQLHFDEAAVAKPDRAGRIKFVTVALMAMVVCLPFAAVGGLLPTKATPVLHALVWAMLIVVSALMIRREWFRFG